MDETAREPFKSPLLRKHMPGLDILRGVAILSVVLYHGLYQGPLVSPPFHTIWARLSSLFVFGWLGVFLFFVLSGFLITGILLDSKRERFYWRSFYIKRALRILPAFFVVIFLIKAFEHASWPYVALCTFYLANLAGMFHIGGFQYGVLWSLAVEEQFYLGWPSVVKLASRRSLVLIALAILVLSPVLRLISFSNVVPLGDMHMTWLISDNLIADRPWPMKGWSRGSPGFCSRPASSSWPPEFHSASCTELERSAPPARLSPSNLSSLRCCSFRSSLNPPRD
jgi:peptidoglycan/LPS O-acetylase OafA/YrhL